MTEINSLRGFLKPLFLLFLISILIMGQPDLGSTAIVCILVVGILFYAGISFSQLCLLILLISLLGYLAITTSPMRIARVLAFTDPFAADVVLNAGWQLSNSLISIGQGGWFGVGLGNSFQKSFYLPEAHTDYIISVISEEFGVVAIMLILLLFLIFIYMVFKKISFETNDKAKLILIGSISLILMQATIHIGVNIRLFPTTGMTLPFLSYGGSSIISTSILAGIILNLTKRKIT